MKNSCSECAEKEKIGPYLNEFKSLMNDNLWRYIPPITSQKVIFALGIDSIDLAKQPVSTRNFRCMGASCYPDKYIEQYGGSYIKELEEEYPGIELQDGMLVQQDREYFAALCNVKYTPILVYHQLQSQEQCDHYPIYVLADIPQFKEFSSNPEWEGWVPVLFVTDHECGITLKKRTTAELLL
ncbi:hypothetical protein PCE1_002942 [Barthelona sp. PCE]